MIKLKLWWAHVCCASMGLEIQETLEVTSEFGESRIVAVAFGRNDRALDVLAEGRLQKKAKRNSAEC